MKLSICIVNWNVSELLNKCLGSIYKHPSFCDFEVIVVDNDSKDDSVKMIKSNFPQVILIENKVNSGFSSGNNSAIKRSTGEYLLLLNPDTEVTAGSLDKLVRLLDANDKAGMVAPKLLNPDGSLQRSCLGFPTLGAMAMRQLFIEQIWPNNPFTKPYLMNDFKHDKATEVDQPMGACILVRRKVLDKIGLFDENSFMFFDEVDLCYRAKKAGWKIFFTPGAQITHHGGSSIKKWGAFNLSRHWTRSRNYYFKKNYGKLALWTLYFVDALRIAILLLVVFGIYKLIRSFI